jgi:peptide deformylase
MKFPIKKIQTGINNPILRHVSEEIEEITEELGEFCDKLLLLMRENQ